MQDKENGNGEVVDEEGVDALKGVRNLLLSFRLLKAVDDVSPGRVDVERHDEPANGARHVGWGDDNWCNRVAEVQGEELPLPDKVDPPNSGHDKDAGDQKQALHGTRDL